MIKILIFLLFLLLTIRGEFYTDETEPIYMYRVVNWCVSGRYEHALFKWPFVQFKTFLLKTEAFRDYGDNKELKGNKPVYSLKFKQIKCSYNKIGYNGALFQTAHLEFKSSVPIEGLLIQGNHAPFGVGFPFGVFDSVDEWSETPCQCNHYFSEIVPCLTRPDIEYEHPTAAVFHYKMVKEQKTQKRSGSGGSGGGGGGGGGGSNSGRNPGGEGSSNNGGGGGNRPRDNNSSYEVGKKSELHWNFRWHSHFCTSSQVVEFWVLVVHSFQKRQFEITKFGPFNFANQYRGWEKILFEGSKSWAGGFTGIFQPTFMPSPLYPQCFGGGDGGGEEARNLVKSASLHQGGDGANERKLEGNNVEGGGNGGNNPPAPRMNFLERIKRQNSPGGGGGGEGSGGGGGGNKPQLQCDGTSDYVFSTDKLKLPAASRIRYTGHFDSPCTVYYPKGEPHKQCGNWTGRFLCYGRWNERNLNNPVILKSLTETKKRLFNLSFCKPCEIYNEEDIWIFPQIFKINGHGTWFAFAYFFIFPIAIVIGRFYKETFNKVEHEYKGWKLWLSLHVALAIFGIFLAYVAYMLPTLYMPLTEHNILGYATLCMTALAFITGWGRYKEKWFNIVLFVIHVASGYIAWILAVVCFVTYPSISQEARVVCYVIVSVIIAFELGLTIYICCKDKKIGLQPKRYHIPILHARLVDERYPGYKCRVIFLIIYVILLLSLVLLMLIVPFWFLE